MASTHSTLSAQNISITSTEVNIVGGNQFNLRSSSDDERCDIAHWLSPLNFKASQSQFLQIHEKGTGNWLLESPIFQSWRDGTSQTLWCPGNPGAGKTILASLVVNHLRTFFKDSNVGIACIFCNYKEQTLQTVTNLIASLLKQFVQDCPFISQNIKSFRHRHKVQSTLPTLDELIEILELEIKTYPKVFIVVDALDECSDGNGSRIQLLNVLLRFSGSISLMVTSRDLPSIEHHFPDTQRLHIRATDGDVAKYVQRQLASCPGLLDLQDIATERIVESAKGMFLLARLHINALLEQDSEAAVLHALNNLPDQIDQIYDDALERIDRQRNTKELAMRALSWIIYASRPLSIEELQHALAVSPGMTKMDRRDLVFNWKLTSVCAGLVVIDKGERVVRLAHYTTQQYFENRRESQFPNAEATIAATCLTYLLFDVFARGYCKDEAELESLLKDNPFLDYAARNWGRHARQNQKSVINLAMDFLGNSSNVQCASQVMLARAYGSEYFARNFSGVHMAACLGLGEIVYLQLDDGADANRVDSYSRTPLSYAAEGGHDSVIQLLLARDEVDVDLKDSNGRTPLSYASENGHDTIINLFLARDDVQADSVDDNGRTPLSYAAERGHNAVVELFLARDDIRADSKGSWNSRTPLSYAVQNGHDAVADLFLARDDVEADSKDWDLRTPLSYAAQNGHDAIVKLFLARDDVQADPKDSNDRTPLSYAAESGHDAIVQLFLDQVNVQADSEDDNDRTPLSYAAENGHDTVVKLFFARGDVQADSKDLASRTPLWYATRGGHDIVVKLLLARDNVQVSSADVDGRTPLSYAAENGHDAIVELFLARGNVQADSNDLDGRTALSYAAENGHRAIVELFLARDDVQIDSTDSSGRTPLSYAAESGHDAIVQLFLDQVNVHGLEGS